MRIEWVKKLFSKKDKYFLPIANTFDFWARNLFTKNSIEPPTHATIFTIEQLELHAFTLAKSYQIGKFSRGQDLLKQLEESAKTIDQCHQMMSEAHSAERRLTPAAEWLLDNHYLIEEKVSVSKKHFPSGYRKRLPHLISGSSAGYPRVFDLMDQLVRHVDGMIDDESLTEFVKSFQSVTHLSLGELWAIPIMLRLSLIEHLKRVTESISWQRAHRDRALHWASRINYPLKQQELVMLELSDMIRENPPLSSAFVSQFMQSFNSSNSSVSAFIMSWLEQKLTEQGKTIEEVMRVESERQAANQASMSNSFAGLRFVESYDWKDFVENNSSVNDTLRKDPSGFYSNMDFVTRNSYRAVVERFARQMNQDEDCVATMAISIAQERTQSSSQCVEHHVGYFLLDAGRADLEDRLKNRRTPSFRLSDFLSRFKLSAYLIFVSLISLSLFFLLSKQSRDAEFNLFPFLLIGLFIAATQFAIVIVNWVVMLLRFPKPIPRMDFENGIPEEFRTIVIVPSVLSSAAVIEDLIEGIELRYLANRDKNLWFALVTDFNDAQSQEIEGDQELLQQARLGIDTLNTKYGNESHGNFFLLHRRRLFNPQENCWMGRERKRGKIEDFNALLCGKNIESFCFCSAPVSVLQTIAYVITLDTDTTLPWGGGWRLVAAAAHPLNRAVLSEDESSILRGYAILQPRVSVSLNSARQSYYSRLLSGEVGLDPYTKLVSDLYQDLFGEASFIGKGIYEVSAFRKILGGRFPENAILSHDLLESCYAKTGQCSDVELLEKAPAHYLSDISRRHRWMRGDWQVAPWLAQSNKGKKEKFFLAALGKWKILDNLRRTLVAPSYLLLFSLGWFALPHPERWTLALICMLLVPELLPATVELWTRPSKLPIRVHLAELLISVRKRIEKVILWIVFLPFETQISLDAVFRSIWRMYYSKMQLLEWETSAASAESHSNSKFLHVLTRMWTGPLLASILLFTLLIAAQTQGREDGLIAVVSAAPLLFLWFFSPVVAWWVSQPIIYSTEPPHQSDLDFLRETARRTWRYFEEFAGASENFLPPDNVQFDTVPRIAHRTSPTNIGVSLLSHLSAYDLGYMTSSQLLARAESTFSTLEGMERYRGHFFNWYDSLSMAPLAPQYVSVVDSGNFVGHLRVFQSGITQVSLKTGSDAAVIRDGLHDILRLFATEIQRTRDPRLKKFEMFLIEANKILQQNVTRVHERLHWLNDIYNLAKHFHEQSLDGTPSEVNYWMTSFLKLVEAHRQELNDFYPWLAYSWGKSDSKWWFWASQLSTTHEASELLKLTQDALAELAFCSAENSDLYQAFQSGEAFVTQQIQLAKVLEQRAQKLGTADFTFLYNTKRKLFSIGYWVDDRRLDPCYYDLLASEARLASYVAVAEGQIPFEHWFTLGRKMTTTQGQQILLSWSGSMFEYLMPLIVMPSFGGSLLDRSCRVAVNRQIQYGSQRAVPWGISESCYSLTDAEGTYQYKAFGIPGLGLQRGLADDLVVSPYSTLLALTIDPNRACKNLRVLSREGLLGRYGFFEAIDYTPSRLQKNQENAVVKTVMAHHQGMGLLSLSQSIRGPLMQQRFLANTDFKAAAVLLHERIPKGNVVIHPYSREARTVRPGIDPSETIPLRRFTSPLSAYPEVHLLSNGRYHVMISNSGGGYSTCQERALTRWREDATRESNGPVCYIADLESKKYWTNAFLPVLQAGSHYESIFLPGRAEFRRQDEGIETHTEIAVSSEDDLEVRRIHLTNRTNRSRLLSVTGFTEIVLAPPIEDELHRVFSNLFLQTEVLKASNAILAHRRPRSSDEQGSWMFCIFQSSDTHIGSSSFETSRMRCFGRGRSAKNPMMMDDLNAFAEGASESMDPCFSIRRNVSLKEDSSVFIDFILGSAHSKQEALALVLKYQDHRMADRVFQVAAAHSQAVLSHIGAHESEVVLFEELASAVIFSQAPFRAPTGTLRRNRKGQSWLWKFGISGDLPIFLLRISSSDNLQIVRDALRAHAYWRMKGLKCDLVILNDNNSGYRRVLYDEIMSLISAGSEAHIIDKPGGIFVRHIENFSEDDKVLILAVSRIVMQDKDGTLERQLRDRFQIIASSNATALSQLRQNTLTFGFSALTSRHDSHTHLSEDNLIFNNGTGGFSEDGLEYIIQTTPHHKTPMPWVNVIANSRLGTVVSESGSSFTWFSNSQLYRLSPWNNDPVTDASGERLFLRDDSNGRFFSLSPLQTESNLAYTCRHGIGYSSFEHRENDLLTNFTCFVAKNEPVKFFKICIQNKSMRSRSLSLFASIDLVLGDLKSKHSMHVITELETLTGAIFARNFYNGDFADIVTFLDCSELARSVSGDRAEFLGRNEDPSAPTAMKYRRLSDRLGAGLDPCASMQVQIEIPQGGEREVVFILGAGNNYSEALSLVKSCRGIAPAAIALEEVERFWKETTAKFHAKTPDHALNMMMNAWLPYQVLSCRIWGRSAFYQSGGAFGFRDQLQDSISLLHQLPEIARLQITRSAAQQFIEGDVQHWWHPPSGRGVRTKCSDDYLWLPYAVCLYVDVTGDMAILDEQIPFLSGRKLTESEESYYDMPEVTEQSESLFQHCVRAVQFGRKYGAHGVPLIGSGDWNDGMNRVGHQGKGESVWLGFFLHEVLTQFAKLAASYEKEELARDYLAEAQNLASKIESNCWDGQWYVRAYFDDGRPIGSELSDECNIDSLPQSWATIANVGDTERKKMALDSVWERLMREDLKILQLFDPPYRNSSTDPGYIKGYPPGVRENAGQYTHAAIWAAWAYALAGQNKRATQLISSLNPINHALNPKAVQTYRVEPYVVCADISSQAPYEGRGGWSWYTGSAAWYYRLLHEVVFGVQKRGNTLRFNPYPPPEWKSFELSYRFKSTTYDLTYRPMSDLYPERGVWLNSEKVTNGELQLVDTGKRQKVEVIFKPAQEPLSEPEDEIVTPLKGNLRTDLMKQ